MSLITEQIDSIIVKRKSKIKQIDEASEKLKKCSRSIDRLKSIQSDINSGNGRFSALFKDPEIALKIGNISLKRFDELSIEYTDELNRLKKRFDRDQLHISFVGRMRQGKSTLIQTISGLDADVIPSSSGTACTGAKSLITNSDTDKVNAEITFYSESEMINIINDYLRCICHSSEYCISMLSQLRNIPIDKIEGNIPNGYADESILFEKLKNYYDHSDDIIENCTKGRITVSKEDIEKYVAQYSHKNRDEKYYNFLSVKTADIHCHFPFENAGKIKLLDTIGLEDNLLNVDEDMFNTIKNDSDAIIYMRLPAETGADVDRPDVTVISDIAKKISPEYAREMLFWVVNNKPGVNDDQCKAYINKIDKNKFAVSDVIKANCSSKEDVETHLLMPILDKISRRIEVVDELIVANSNEKGKELLAECERILNQLENVFVGAVNDDIKKDMHTTIDDTYKLHLLNSLKELHDITYKELSKRNCEQLEETINEILDNLNLSIPSKDVIINKAKHNKSKHETLLYFLRIVRLNIINAFNVVDETMDAVVKKMKTEVVEIFAHNGLLGKIVPFEAGSDPNEWIDNFIVYITSIRKYTPIQEALEHFKEYNCIVQGMIVYIVRDKLFGIDEQQQNMLNAMRSKDTDYESRAEEIVEIFKNALYDISKDIRKEVEKLYMIPNKSMYAAIYDLHDRLSEDGQTDVEWRYLYEDNISKIWPEEYNAKIMTQEVSREWSELICSISECCSGENFKIKF